VVTQNESIHWEVGENLKLNGERTKENAMQAERSQSQKGNQKIKSIDEALKTLNESANESSDKILSMIESDYKDLKNILSETKPKAKRALHDLKSGSMETLQKASEEAKETAINIKEKADESVGRHPWYYIGSAAAVGGLLGYLWGRKSS
jgi:ElaB/YqjD/DUF883 family membrane-anchored ribosome-binding protein